MSNIENGLKKTLMVTDEASAQFAPLFCENKEAKAILHQYCDAIDVLAREFDGVTFEASVHDENMEVSVTFECPDIVIRTQKHRFYDLVERSNAVRFSHGEGDTVAVEFVFPSIWNRTV